MRVAADLFRTPMPAVSLRCRLCGTAGTPLLRARDNWVRIDDSRDFEIIYCSPCEIAWTEPPLSRAELASYYPDRYEPYGAASGLRSTLQRLMFRSDLKRITAAIPGGRRLFELGCGNGAFLAAAKVQGWSVAGREPSEAGRRSAREEHHLEIDGGAAEEIVFVRSYDVVVARHTLEHLDDPAEVLTRIHRDGLASGGLLYLKLPTIDGWEAKRLGARWRGWDAPRHRFHFSRAGIGKLLERIGFADVRVRPEIVPQDWIESVAAARSGVSGLLGAAGAVARALPAPLRLAAGAVGAVLMAPAGAGRMIVCARRL